MYDSGDTAWMLVSTALVLLMLPGLAIFYSGMVRAKNALGMLMYSMSAMVAVTITWTLVGYTLAFGDDAWGGLVGDLKHAGLSGLTGSAAVEGLSFPPIAFAMFQMMFAVVTGALITGAAADRMKFGAMLTFLAIWSVAVYPVVAHWTWGPGGWMREWGVLDFAGGTVVEICSGASALAVALVLGPRLDWPRLPMAPHNLPLTILGAGLLWFGWIGFNAGSALAADGVAASAALATHLSGVGGIAGWLILEQRLTGKPTALGAASGGVAGLVAITPAAGFVDPFASLLLGFVAGAVCFMAIRLKFRFRYDDSLDVVAVHYVGGVVGMLFLGLFARAIAADGTTEPLALLNSGAIGQLGKQLVAVVATSAFAFVASWVIAMSVRAVMGLRVTPEGEEQGIDYHQHGERAYEIRG